MSFVFTCGDINGIGPEISLKAIANIRSRFKKKIVFLCPEQVFDSVRKFVSFEMHYEIISSFSEISDDDSVISIVDFADAQPQYGKITAASGDVAYKAIKKAYSYVSENDERAMITAPISKEAIQLAGHDFPGHTEMLAKWGNTKDFVMMFLASKMNAALITIHEPLKKVPSLITKNNLRTKLDGIVRSLRYDFKIRLPRIAVLGLNPHAGENGVIGNEENEIIIPVVQDYGVEIEGPFPADGFFSRKLYKEYDVVVGMYHDQVLTPFKMAYGDRGVNYTAGLPIVRTSPDHGTAFNIAGQGIADEKSIYQAFVYAQKIVRNRRSSV